MSVVVLQSTVKVNISAYLKKDVPVLTTLPVSLIPIDQYTNRHKQNHSIE